MRNTLMIALFLLVSLAWAVAQQPQTDTSQMPGQATPPSSGQMPGEAAPPSSAQPMAAGEVTEGCLAGTAPNFTITDKAGTKYTLTLPQGADPSVLTKHVGESVQVLGEVNKSGASASASLGAQPSIDVKKIGRGTGTCPGSTTGEKPPSK